MNSPEQRPGDDRLTGDFTSDLDSELTGEPIYRPENLADDSGSAAGSHDPQTMWAAGRHRTDIGHLVMGLAFLAFVGCWALIQADLVTGSQIRWLMPLPWVVAGAVGLAVTARLTLKRHRR